MHTRTRSAGAVALLFGAPALASPMLANPIISASPFVANPVALPRPAAAVIRSDVSFWRPHDVPAIEIETETVDPLPAEAASPQWATLISQQALSQTEQTEQTLLENIEKAKKSMTASAPAISPKSASESNSESASIDEPTLQNAIDLYYKYTKSNPSPSTAVRQHRQKLRQTKSQGSAFDAAVSDNIPHPPGTLVVNGYPIAIRRV